ncbi:ABC-type transport auxiliary lipoprotein family protein [Acidovorax sp.]|uniref:ABC-type transport auxiliary lipoprotein family protein n=1 Tax=Acidovorax sp. TaxID=1872122 RepID=UPI00260520C0|nr:ABC-type transport auxiliary lipoprotein family protein [Acidovorax sp.]
MKTIKNIANKAYISSAGAVFGLILLAGCSALPEPPARPALYDFGPGPVVPAPTDRRALLSPLALADVEATGLPEGSNAVLYRLGYSDAQQLRPYSQARWSQPPAQLVQQRLREQLGQRRAILKGDDGAAQAREAAQGGKLPLLLRVELEEFSHLFTTPTDSAGVVRLRATLVELTPAGESLRGQRVFIVQQPARSADAAGGVAALAEATGQLAKELAVWVEQTGQ